MQLTKEYNPNRAIITSQTAVNLSLALGVALGVVASFSISNPALASISDMSEVLASLSKGEWLGCFIKSFIFAEGFVLACFLCGFGAIYQPVSLALCSLRGAGLGICIRGIYSNPDTFTNLSAFLPFAVASTALIALQAKQSVKMSGCYLSLTVTNENRLGIKNEIRDYSAKFLILSITLAILSALNCILLRLVASVI